MEIAAPYKSMNKPVASIFQSYAIGAAIYVRILPSVMRPRANLFDHICEHYHLSLMGFYTGKLVKWLGVSVMEHFAWKIATQIGT